MRRSLLVLCVFSALPTMALAQSRDTASVKARPSAAGGGTPACCSIVRIEKRRAMAAARETATGFTFYFSVKNKRLLATLKIGQPVWADFAAKTVKLKATDPSPCCAIVESPPPPEEPHALSR